MCNEIGAFSDKEVAKLDAKGLKALRAEAGRHFRSRDIQKLISKDPIGRIIHPHKDVRKKLREKLLPKYNELKKAARGR